MTSEGAAKPKEEAEAASQIPLEHKDGVKPLTPGCARPVMIHRAIYGSFERFIGILTEHFGGKW
jgi:threonyl-tRNA synthetase